MYLIHFRLIQRLTVRQKDGLKDRQRKRDRQSESQRERDANREKKRRRQIEMQTQRQTGERMDRQTGNNSGKREALIKRHFKNVHKVHIRFVISGLRSRSWRLASRLGVRSRSQLVFFCTVIQKFVYCYIFASLKKSLILGLKINNNLDI